MWKFQTKEFQPEEPNFQTREQMKEWCVHNNAARAKWYAKNAMGKSYRSGELSVSSLSAAIHDQRKFNTRGIWWAHILDDATAIGIKITGFTHNWRTVTGLIRTGFSLKRRAITGEFTVHPQQVVDLILGNYPLYTPMLEIVEKYETTAWTLTDDVGGQYDNLAAGDSFLNELLELFLTYIYVEYRELTDQQRIERTLCDSQCRFNADGQIITNPVTCFGSA